MTDLIHVANKQLVWSYWQAMNACTEPTGQVAAYLAGDVVWHGFEPLRRLRGSAEIQSAFWSPLHQAMPDLLRRPTVFLAGHYDDAKFGSGDWVCGTGEFIGTFAQNWWLGDILIPASGTTVRFRFGEFCKVEAKQIVEIRLLVDLPDLLRQVGVSLLPDGAGCDVSIPGPLAGDGVVLGARNSAETEKTYSLVTEMIFGGLNKYDGKDQASQGLEQFWHSDMVWHGPVGVGSAYGIDEFKRNAQGPIVHAFPDRKGVGHQARIAEGHFAASTGWPSLGGTHRNRFLDWEPTGERIGWNIMDFWRRDGDKLGENWVMIDMIGAAMASKVDLLAALRKM